MNTFLTSTRSPAIGPTIGQTIGRAARRLVPLGMLAVLVAAQGCSSLRYKKSEELWAESEQRFRSAQYAEAVPYYDEILRRDGEDAEARFRRGFSREHAGEAPAALEDYEACGSKGDTRALLHRANLNVRSGAYDAAEHDLAALRDSSLEPHDKVVQLTLVGTLRLRQGNARLAAQSLERACDLARGAADVHTMNHARGAHYNASQAYYQLGEFDKAAEHIDQYAKLTEATGAALDGEDCYQIGVDHYLAGDFEGAKGWLAKADPDRRAKAADILSDPAFFGARK